MIKQFLESSFSGLVPTAKAVLRVLRSSYEISAILSPDVPFSFSREGKPYVGYYAFSKELTIRFEAKASQKNTLASISVWETGSSLSGAPRSTIEVMPGFDLSSAGSIAAAIANGKQLESRGAEGSTALQESTADVIKQFVSEVGDEGGSFSSMYRKYMQWAHNNGERVVSDITFTEYLKKLRAGASAPRARTDVQVQPGIPDDPAEQPPEYDEFELEILNNNVLYKYAMLAEIVKKIVTWDPLYRNAFIYGAGGVGKTYTVTQVIKEFADPNRVVVYKGAISGFTGLLQILWQDREGKIIILDDNDAILENINALNLLKGAMENADPRIVSYTRFKRGKPVSKEEKRDTVIDVSRLHERIVTVYAKGEKLFEEFVSPAEARWYEKASGIRIDKHALREDFETEGEDTEDDELFFGKLDPNVDPAFGYDETEGVPDKFQFTSRVIFISNLMKVPQPLMDRCISIGLLLTKQQILDLIEDKLDFIMKAEAPQVSLDEKKEVLEFMRKYVHRIGKPLTFRLFMQLVAILHSGHKDAKKMMYLTMLGEGMKSTMR